MSVQVRSETQTDRRPFLFSVDVALCLLRLVLSLFESLLYLVLDFVYEKATQVKTKITMFLNTHKHTQLIRYVYAVISDGQIRNRRVREVDQGEELHDRCPSIAR